MKLFKKLFTAVLSILIFPIFVMAEGGPQKPEELAEMIKNNVSGLPNYVMELKNTCFMNVGIQKIFTKKDAMIIVFNHGKTIDCTSSDTLKKNSPIWNLYKIAMAQLSKQDPYEYCLNLRRLYGEQYKEESPGTTTMGYECKFYDYIQNEIKKLDPLYEIESHWGNMVMFQEESANDKDFIIKCFNEYPMAFKPGLNVTRLNVMFQRNGRKSSFAFINNEPIKIQNSTGGFRDYLLNFVSIRSGAHFYCYKRVDSEWFCLNDSHISKVDVADISKQGEIFTLTYESV